MIIKSLKLINFRQFKGEVNIDFSVDPSKKATIIMAENTAGKTTLIESFSWIFYGSTKLKTIWNTELLNECDPGKSVKIEGYTILEHNGIEYTICRTSKKWKNTKTFSSEDDTFEITYVDSEGISQKQVGQNASRLINKIVPKDLFSYFFFKGEQIEKIGKDMAGVNKSVESKEFIKAVRGLLGFSSLYEAMKHLRNLSNKYNSEIASNNNDEKLSAITNEIISLNKQIKDANLALNGNDKQPGLYQSLAELKEQKEKKSEEIASYKAAEIMQKRTLTIGSELISLDNQISKKRKEIFEKFSSKSYDFFAKKLKEIAEDTLKHEDAIDKGIPSMDSKSIDYILNVRKKCLCGRELTPGNEAYNNIEEFRKYVPPVGIGTEIEMMKQFLSISSSNAGSFYSDFKKAREDLSRLISSQAKLKDEKNDLDEKIANIPDVTKLKNEEKELEQKVVSLNIRIRNAEDTLEKGNARIDVLNKAKEQYSTADTHIQKLLKYQTYCDCVYKKIDLYCRTHEKNKKVELQDAINRIFKEIFDTDIQLVLNDKYEIFISDKDMKTLEDLENSTSQDGIMAFSFIAGIIELAGKPKSGRSMDDLDEEISTEPYPLVMDAPSSSFDKKRIRAFSTVLPRIAQQVIIFIKDTDGEYLEEDLGFNVGKKYEIVKHNKYYSTIGGRK